MTDVNRPTPDGGPAISSQDDLTSAIGQFVAAAQAGAPVLVASDFDGVLAPLVDDPAQSRPLPRASAALARIAAVGPHAVLALVSGRDLVTLVDLSGPPPGTRLIGSHGAELGRINSGPAPGHAPNLTHSPVELTSEQRTQLTALAAGLEQIASTAQGAWVEHKPAAAVLHTRLATPEAGEAASARARELGEQIGVRGLTGKNVVEFAVIETTKGIALTALREEINCARVFYMGDDVTDEHAFARLTPDDFTVRVGPGDTLARFRVPDPDAAAQLLEDLAAALENHVVAKNAP